MKAALHSSDIIFSDILFWIWLYSYDWSFGYFADLFRILKLICNNFQWIMFIYHCEITSQKAVRGFFFGGGGHAIYLPSQECDITANSQWHHRKITELEMCEITVVSKCNLTGTLQWYHSLRSQYELNVRSQRSQSVTSQRQRSDITVWDSIVGYIWEHRCLKV